jgi:hypothetical protein
MILVLKLLLTPILIALATLAGRRWGPAFSGWFIGFPLTSGPVSVILALQHGPAFATQAAIGNLGGLASISAFCLAYTVVARRWSMWTSLASAIGAYLLATALWNQFHLSLWLTLVIALMCNGLVILLIPKSSTPIPAAATGRWDIPARMCIATAFVFTLTTSASALGPQLSGLITPFPIFGSVLAAFTHRQQGADAARNFLRGHAVSLFGFAAFFLVVGSGLMAMPMTWVYLLATFSAIVVNGVTLRLGS